MTADNTHKTIILKRTLLAIVCCLSVFVSCSAGITFQAHKQKWRQELGIIPSNDIPERCDSSRRAKAHNGLFEGMWYDGVLSFKGIPYAQPPVGKFRWKAPQEMPASNALYEAKHFGKSLIQKEILSEKNSFHVMGEDGLTLNVWTADKHGKKPVMVWIHGGSYNAGSTANPLYDGHRFVKNHPDIILVTINYRLGILGFLDLTMINGGADYPESGNLGLLDQVAALRWVHRNIGAFGGDADNVTVFGESAGGGSVALLAILPEAQGLFRRMIVQSGSVVLTSTKADARILVEQLLKVSGAKHVDDLLKLSEEEIKLLNNQLYNYHHFPIRDGHVIPLNAFEPYVEGHTAHIDMLIGSTQDETRLWIGAMQGVVKFGFGISYWYNIVYKSLGEENKKHARNFLKQTAEKGVWKKADFFTHLMFRAPAVAMASYHADAGGTVYMYLWNKEASIKHRKAQHAVELSYVFGNLDETVFTGSHPNAALSEEVQQMWVNFAKTGDPSTRVHRWPKYDTTHRYTMVLDDKIYLVEDPESGERISMAPLLKEWVSPHAPRL